MMRSPHWCLFAEWKNTRDNHYYSTSYPPNNSICFSSLLKSLRWLRRNQNFCNGTFEKRSICFKIKHVVFYDNLVWSKTILFIVTRSKKSRWRTKDNYLNRFVIENSGLWCDWSENLRVWWCVWMSVMFIGHNHTHTPEIELFNVQRKFHVVLDDIILFSRFKLL